jgi:UDP-galactopyranose mutase
MEIQNYSINANISWKLLKDKVVAVNMDNGNYYTFNFTSSLIWQYIDQKKTITEVEQLMAEQFSEVTSQILKDDVGEIIEYWISEKLISKI